jgi:protein-tyrosine-phosphatase
MVSNEELFRSMTDEELTNHSSRTLAQLPKKSKVQTRGADREQQPCYRGAWTLDKTTMNPSKIKVLFLCTGNAARSQMAEALARLYHGEALDPVSAGSRPAFGVHSLAVDVMAELGSDIAGARSKSAEEFRDTAFDAVVTVCDSAAQDCPTWPSARRIEHWSIEDPSFEPDPEVRYRRFVETRDDLRRRIDFLVSKLRAQKNEHC